MYRSPLPVPTLLAIAPAAPTSGSPTVLRGGDRMALLVGLLLLVPIRMMARSRRQRKRERRPGDKTFFGEWSDFVPGHHR